MVESNSSKIPATAEHQDENDDEPPVNAISI